MKNDIKVFLKQLFCFHDYELMGASYIYANGGRRIGNQLTFRCKKCGKTTIKIEYYEGE